MNPRALTNAFNLKLIKNKLALSLFHIFSPTNKDQGQIDQSGDHPFVHSYICLAICSRKLVHPITFIPFQIY